MTPPGPPNPWQAVVGLVQELKACAANPRFTRAGTVLAYVCLDTMAFLAMPAAQSQQSRTDFMAWVDTYLTAHPSQPYQYRGLDVYAARCGLLHAFSAEAELHRKDPAIRVFTYHSGGKHLVDPALDPNGVIIGLASFVNDVARAIEAFLRACEADPTLRARVAARLPTVLHTVPVDPVGGRLFLG
jgi:hypothetical protein